MNEISEIHLNEGQLIVNKDVDKWMLILYRGNHEDYFLKGILKIASFTSVEAEKIIQNLKKQPQVIIGRGKHDSLIKIYETLILAFINCSLVRITSMN